MTTYFVSNAGSNTAPYDTEAKAANALNTIAVLPWAATDTVKLSSTHVETAGVAINYTFPTTIGLKLLSVTFNGSGTGGLAAGAIVQVGAASAALTLGAGFVYGYGISFKAGTNNNVACSLQMGTSTLANGHFWDACSFFCPTANTTARVNIGVTTATNNDDEIFVLLNPTVNNGANKPVNLKCGAILIDNLALAGTAPTSVFAVANSSPFNLLLTASDLSAVAWTNLVDVSLATYGLFVARQCKLRSGFTVTTGTIPGPGQFEVVLQDCNSGDVNYYYTRVNYSGTVTVSNSIYSDASDGSDSISWVAASSGNASFTWPLKLPQIVTYNSTLSAVSSTVEVASNNVTFKDNELWQETLAKITSGVPLGTWNRADRAADILNAGSNQDTSTKTWTGVPGTPVTQKLISGSFTPAEVGPIAVQVMLAKASATAYVSPKVAIA